jgi:hypothetical protein
MVQAVQAAPRGYKPSGSDKIFTKLLAETVNRCRKAVQQCCDQHALTGCALCSDEWANLNSQSVVNFMHASLPGSVFHRFEECSSVEKTGEWIANRLLEVITEVGEEKLSR